MKQDDYIEEVARSAQELIEKEGLSYKEAIEKAEKLLSDRVGAHKSVNSISKRIQ